MLESSHIQRGGRGVNRGSRHEAGGSRAQKATFRTKQQVSFPPPARAKGGSAHIEGVGTTATPRARCRRAERAERMNELLVHVMNEASLLPSEAAGACRPPHTAPSRRHPAATRARASREDQPAPEPTLRLRPGQ